MHRQDKGKLAKLSTRELQEEEPQFQIAPMIDILLVLLVFFMSISSTQVLQTNDNVNLPVAKEAKDAGENKDGRVTVNVLWNGVNNVGSIEIDGKPFYVPGDVKPVLRAAVDKTPDAKVVIRADKLVRYEYLRGLLKAAGEAQVVNVTFSVIDKE
jgi:biopolymer transport protein ExbD